MEIHEQDYEQLLHGGSTLEMWRRSEHAAEVAAELMRMHGGTVPMAEMLWNGAEASLPTPWRAGRAAEPVQAAVEVYNRWRRLEERRMRRRLENP